MGKAKKAKTGGRKKIKDLSPRNAKRVAGGRKAGQGQDYLVVKLNDLIITGITPTGSGSGGGSA